MGSGNVVPRITEAEHIGPGDTGDNIEAKRVAQYVWNDTTQLWERLSVNSDSQLNIVQHSHPNSVNIHFNADLSSTTDFILVDISDTTNYPHVLTNFAHIEYLNVETDASSSAAYTIKIGYLSNVDATNGDFTCFLELNGNKSTGQSKILNYNPYPNGSRCTDAFVVSSDKSLNDTAFQTDVNLKSTLDPANATTPSGSGDLVMRVVVTAGTVSVNVAGSYHTH